MTRGLSACAVALALAAPGAQAACPAWGTELQPADGRTLLVIGQHRDAIDQYVAGTGNRPGGMMVYTGIGAPHLGTTVASGQNGFVHHMSYLMQKYPNTAMQIGLHMGSNDPLLVSLGAYDAQILALAQILKDAARPIYLRIGYEFDGKHNAYNPPDYVKAYRRIVERLRGHGASNVSFVWHSVAGARYGNHPLSAWYPGDCYVDWAGVSLFGQGYNTASFGYANEMANFADARDIPIMIAESTPHGRRTSQGQALWDAWFVNVINWINARDVKVWSYINQNWEANPTWAGWGDSRVEANATIESLWMTEISKPRYLHSSPTLYCAELHRC
jgi:hypothetical protein